MAATTASSTATATGVGTVRLGGAILSEEEEEENGLNALYDVVNGGGDVWINENRFKILRQLGEGGFAYVFLVKEVLTDTSSASGGGSGLAKKVKDTSISFVIWFICVWISISFFDHY